MKTIKEHQKAIIDYYKEMVEYHTTVFALKQMMIEKDICPRCGHRTHGKGMDGDMYCFDCGFKLTAWEIDQTLEGYKGYLTRQLKKKRKTK